MISPVAVYGLRPAAKLVPEPSAAVFQPAKVYPVRKSPVPVSSEVFQVDLTTAFGTVLLSLVFPLPS